MVACGISAIVTFAQTTNVRNLEQTTTGPIEIGSTLQLFVDDAVIDALHGLQLRLQTPQKQPLAASPVTGSYLTIIKDGDLYRAYYRDYDPSYTYTRPRPSGHPGEITCYAESRDGHEWTFPHLGLYEIDGTRDNNVILAGQSPFSHNFSPFLDTRPDVNPDERFKAVAGHPGFQRKVKADGLHTFASPDGIRWKKISQEPVIPFDMSWSHAFDSQNVAFWSEAEKLYVCYFRSWTAHGGTQEVGEAGGGLRSISRTTSPDFKNWSTPVTMNPNLPGEHLYTSQTHPYFRAPHIYIALPSRFVAGRVGTEKTHAMLGSTDILLMSSRAGSITFDRLFTEAFIRPGLDPERWESRANYVALNVVPTGPAEMSIYNSRSGHRYTLRTDGFVSVHAGAEEGELLTKPLIFSGGELVLNYSTAAAGGMRVAIQTPEGAPVNGFGLADCSLIVGDEIEHVVCWSGNPDLSALAGKAVCLRFVMQEADLFSFRFRETGVTPDGAKKSAKQADAIVFPGKEWLKGDPEDFGISLKAMEDIDELMKKSQANGVLIRNGYLIGQWNYAGPSDMVIMAQSISKSITSMMLGLALRDGLISSLDDKVKDYWPDFETGPYTDEISFRHLASMTSGMAATRWYGMEYFDPGNIKPGTQHHYHNDQSQALARALTYIFGKPLQEVLREKALNDMQGKMEWEVDKVGTMIKAANGKMAAVHFGHSFTHWTAQDLARIGHLYLTEGKWRDKQILPREFVRESLADIPYKINPWFGQSEERLKVTGYGLSWWTTRGSDSNVWWMGGRGRQFCMVLPDYGIVMTKLNDWKPRPDNYDRAYFERIIMDCLKE